MFFSKGWVKWHRTESSFLTSMRMTSTSANFGDAEQARPRS